MEYKIQANNYTDLIKLINAIPKRTSKDSISQKEYWLNCIKSNHKDINKPYWFYCELINNRYYMTGWDDIDILSDRQEIYLSELLETQPELFI